MASKSSSPRGLPGENYDDFVERQARNSDRAKRRAFPEYGSRINRPGRNGTADPTVDEDYPAEMAGDKLPPERRRRERRPSPRRASPLPRNAPAPPGYRTAVKIAGGGATGLILGAIAYALILSVVDYGPSGPKLWFKAKFLNEPAPGPTTIFPAPAHAPGLPQGAAGNTPNFSAAQAAAIASGHAVIG